MTNALASTLSDHPRLIGALFTALLLASQAGSALAAECGAYHGP